MQRLSGEAYDRILFSGRIIVAALAVGPLLFAGVAIYLRWQGGFGEGRESTAPLLTYLSILVAALCLGMRLFLPRLIAAQGLKHIAAGTYRAGRAHAGSDWHQLLAREGSQGALLSLHLTVTIVGAAVLEGAALMGSVAYLLEGQTVSLAIGLAFPLALLLVQMPTHNGVRDWIEQQERLLREQTP